MGNVRWSRNSPFAPLLKGAAKVLHHHAPPLKGVEVEQVARAAPLRHLNCSTLTRWSKGCTVLK